MRLLGTIVLGWVMSAVAPGPADAGEFYAGAGAGLVEAEDAWLGPAFTTTSDSGWNVFAGHRFTDHVALEAGYWDLGEVKNSGVSACSYAYDTRTRQASLSAVGRFPLSARFTLTALAGLARTSHSNNDVHPSTNVVPGLFCIQVVRNPFEPADETSPMWGAGAEWAIVSRASLRLAWTRHDNDFRARNSLMLSVAWTF